MLRNALSEYQRSVVRSIINMVTYPTHALPPSFAETAVDEDVAFRYEGSIRGIEIIFSTSSGVFLFDGDKGVSRRVLKGAHYGLTKYNDGWLVARSNRKKGQKLKRLSDIRLARFDDSRVTELKLILFGLPGEIHQIDMINDILYLPHTGINQILFLPMSGVITNRFPATILSCGSISLSINQRSHLNSIFYDRHSGEIYVVAH